MFFTGSQLTIKRNFYTQTGNFGLGLTCSVNSATGTYWFGVSGDQGTFEFVLQSGRLLQNGLFLHTYQSNRQFGLEAQFNTGNYNVIKDSTPLIFGLPKTTGNYNYFYFKRSSADISGEFDLYVTGDSFPNYTIQQNGYLTTSGQNAVTGYFINPSTYPIRIFDSDAINPQNLNYSAFNGNILANSSGRFSFTGDFTQFDLSQPILTTFATNFGDTSVLFQIYDVTQYSRFITFNEINDWSFNVNNKTTNTLFYNNWSGNFQSNGFYAGLQLRLDYVSGTGANQISPLAVNTGILVSGFFNKTGNYTGYYSLTMLLSGNSGTFTGSIFQTGYAEGSGNFYFSGIGTGASSGIGYTGQTSGAYIGYVTGFIFSGQTGLFRINGSTVGTGTPINIAIVPTGYLDITNIQYGDTISFGYNSGNPQGRHSIPIAANTGYFEGSGLVRNLRLFPTAYAVTGTTYASGLLLITGISGGYTGNSIRIYSKSGNLGFVSGTNWFSGIGVDGYPRTGQYQYSGSITLTGGEIGFATGFVAISVSAHSIYVYNPMITGYETIVGTPTNSATDASWISIISGSASGYGVNGIITGACVYFTSLISGASGNSIKIQIGSGGGGSINSGTNFSNVAGVQPFTGYNMIKYNSYIQLTGGLDTTVYPITLFTGLLNQYSSGSGQFSRVLYGLQTGGFFWNRSFTGNWDLLTGYDVSSLVSLKRVPNYNDHSISGSGNFIPNGNFVFQVSHNQNLLAADVAQLIITGAGVVSGISTLLYN